MFGTKSKIEKYKPSPDLVRTTYRLLLEDKAMIVVLIVGGLASTAAIAAILVPAWTIGHITPDVRDSGMPGLLVYASVVWVSSFISALTSGVVVAAAQVQCEGGDANVRRALAVSWSRRGPLAAWATLSTIVALICTLLERFGVAGAILRFLAGLSWAVATVFAVPIVIAEGTGPVETARRSAGVVKNQFGTLIRSSVRLSAPWIAAMVVAGIVTAGGIVAFAVGVDDGSPAPILFGAILMVGGGAAFFFCSATSSALSAYLDTLLYRYSTGQPVPGVDPRDMPYMLAP